MEKRQYRFAFDIGIGSCGWAVVSENETGNKKMMMLVRFLLPGEKADGKDQKSGTQRLSRRKASAAPSETSERASEKLYSLYPVYE